MRYLLLLLGLISTAYGQFAPTSAKTAFKNGISIGTRDSTAYTTNDSLVVVINRQGRMMYRSTDGYWKLLSNAGSSDYVPYQGAVGNVFLGSNRIKADAFDLGIPSSSTDSIGRMRWNADDLTMNIGLTSSVVLQSGQEMLILVKNQTGVTIPNGTVVRQSGVVGASGRLKVEPFLANGTHNSNQVLGLTTEDIPNGGDGFVSYFGKVRGLNTAAYPDSTILYASPTVAGGLTNVVPEAPNNIVKIGTVVKSASSNGIIFTRVVAGSNINQDEGVQLTNPLNNSLLVYDSLTTLWKDKTLVEIGAVRVQDTAAMLNPYLRKSDTATMLSNYRRKTTLIENADLRNSAITINGTSTALGGSISVGTVTGVTASAPLSSSGGTTPNITISQATTSTNGFLSSTDWNTFNNKQAQLNGTGFVRFSGTTPSYITGTSSQFVKADGSLDGTSYATAASISGTTNYIPKFTSSSAIGNSIFTESGGNTLRIIAENAAVRLNGSRDYLLQTVDADGRFRIYDQTAAIERVTLTSSGNLGIGVIPNSQAFSGVQSLQIINALLFGYLNRANLLANAYVTSSGGFNYIASDFATRYEQVNGSHVFYTAPSGTAGNPITFTPAMTLTANSELLVNTTTTDGTNKLIVNGGVKVTTGAITIEPTNATSFIEIASSSSSYQSTVYFKEGANRKWEISKAPTTTDLEFYSYGTASSALKLAYSTGAATFSSSVTASSFIRSGGTSSQYLMADGSVSTASAGSSGTYTPTITAVSNVASSTSNQAQYMRVGNVVTVSGYIEVDPTSGSTPTEFRLSLPVATSWSMGSNKAGGVMAGIDGAAVGTIYADVATDTVTFRYTSSASGSNMGISFTFTYLIE